MTLSEIAAIAPDAAAERAGRALATAAWRAAGTDGVALWGEISGSGPSPYVVEIDLAPLAYRCSCPSRKLPCKHALGLLVANASGTVATADAPARVVAWRAERAARAVRSVGADPAAGRTVADDGGAPVVPAAARRRADSRDARVAAGIAECERWLVDVVRLGLAHAREQLSATFEARAARLVDAQCPGLARRLRALPAAFATADWEERSLASLAELSMLCTAYRRLDDLSPALRADVRRHVGWTQTREETLANAFDVVDDEWIVVGARTAIEDRLRARRTWLHGRKSGRPALLLAFAHGGSPLEPAPAPGEYVAATMTFAESAAPLRAGLRSWTSLGDAPLPAGHAIDANLAAFAAALGGDPWLDRWPLVLDGVTPARDGAGWWLCDRSAALPLADDAVERLHAVCGGHPATVSGEWDGRSFAPLGAWSDGRFVALS